MTFNALGWESEQTGLKLVWLRLVSDCTGRNQENCCLQKILHDKGDNRRKMSVMVKRWYRSRRNQFIILSISIICIVYYISLNDSLQREPDLDVTRRLNSTIQREKLEPGMNETHGHDARLKPGMTQTHGHDSRLNPGMSQTHGHDSRKSVIEYIESRIEEALREDKGTGCEIPQLDPFAKEVMQFDKYHSPIVCKGKDWVKCYFSTCRVVDEILQSTPDVVCYYQDIIHVSDRKYYLGEKTTVQGNQPYTLEASDHVKIKCTSSGQGLPKQNKTKTKQHISTWTGYAAGFRNSVKRVHPPSDRRETLNVLILGFDSTSKNGFIRNMPKSFKHLKNHMKSTILDGYNIVGDGTPAALFPILTGKTELELPDVRKTSKNNGTLDSMPFIFYKLASDGYRTAYFEDMPWIGTFQYRFKGFKRQPADHYLRSFYLEQTKKQARYCVGDTPQYQLMLNLTEQFLHLDGKRFAFTFIADITHDASMISVADDALVGLLKSLERSKIFEDTLVIIMADHGPRYAKVRDTLQGKLEERLPLMSVRLPDKLKRMRPHAQAQLEANANALTTPHDIHATILDVLDWSEYMNPFKIRGADFPRGMTLLEPIPKNRSCSEAGIEPHWCACVNWKNVTDKDMIRKTADAFINYLNELTASQRSKCLPRTLTEIQWVMSQRPNSKMLSFVSNKDHDGYLGKFGANTKITKENYQLKVVVGPGHGIYEASMAYVKDDDKFIISTRDISRTNAYGNEPSCISATHPHLNPYCYCSDYVPQTARV
ncbi:hypothetical protein PYW08_010486 [Mythimna loreyi]|uniref:Uncharacterized protein n=1 Tax=Mythimna loreyi TaxID=667449 RepID=A0ACC2Q5A3_9NEOP|nr:hypothetical protein PYW08_010486 [Mythimna loreyi]